MGLGIVALTAQLGCGGSEFDTAGDGDYMDDDIPMGQCGNTGCADTGGVPVGFPCGGSTECSGEAGCVAPFADGQAGDFVCIAQCIPNNDEASWCLDDAACCDETATCSTRGLCVAGAVDDTAGIDSTGADTDTSAGSDTGTDTGSATGSDTGADSSASSSTGG
jgi:hypothetical protein